MEPPRRRGPHPTQPTIILEEVPNVASELYEYDQEGGDEFDEVETLAERGRFWIPRNPEKDHPHKLVLKAIRWEKATSQFNADERDVLVGETKTNETWNIACDNLDLLPLHSGEVKRW